MRVGVVIIFLMSVYGWSQQLLDGRSHPFQIEVGKMKNIHELNEEIYRSDQPTKSDFKELEHMGIRTVISLRYVIKDDRKIMGRNIRLISIPMKASKVDLEDVVEVMHAMTTCERPLLLHCRRGIDRTGVMVAFYRILFHGWSKEKALEEFTSENYGYSEKLFPNLLELLKSADIQKIKEEIER